VKKESRAARVRRAAAAVPTALIPALDVLAEKIAERAIAEADLERRRQPVVRTGREEAA
jgi:hypothetical protein